MEVPGEDDVNWWWLVIVPLGCLWWLPMLGARAGGLPWYFFAAIAALWGVVLLFVRPLYDWGTKISRKLGQERMADLRERLKPKLLPPVRVALLIMAATSAVFIFL